MRLKKKVGKWLAEGIITSEQAEAILNREKPHSLRSQKIGSPYIFLAIASCFYLFRGSFFNSR